MEASKFTMSSKFEMALENCSKWRLRDKIVDLQYWPGIGSYLGLAKKCNYEKWSFGYHHRRESCQYKVSLPVGNESLFQGRKEAETISFHCSWNQQSLLKCDHKEKDAWGDQEKWNGEVESQSEEPLVPDWTGHSVDNGTPAQNSEHWWVPRYLHVRLKRAAATD